MNQSIEERMEDSLQDKANQRFKEFLNSDPTINRNIWPNGAIETVVITPIDSLNNELTEESKATMDKILRDLQRYEASYWRTIVDLVFEFPNDMELGGEVRKFVNQYYK